MEINKRKSYFYDEDAKLTKYAKKKLKRIENEEHGEERSSEKISATSSDNNFNDESTVEVDDFSQEIKEFSFHMLDDRDDNENLSPISNSPKSVYSISHFCRTMKTDKANGLYNKLSIDESSANYSQSPLEDELFSSDEEDLLGILRRKSEQPSRVNNLLNQKRFLESINLETNKSPGEILLMALKLSLANQFTFTAMTGLFQLINKLFDDKVLPETRYMINKLCNHNKNVKCTFHSVCIKCSNYLGVFDKEKLVICQNCNIEFNLCNFSDPSFFILIDPSDAVCDYLQNNENYYDHVINERTHERDHVKDIYDGKAYRQFVKTLSSGDRHTYVTAILNTDGAPVFKCSNYSIWPIYIMLNELPMKCRFNNLIVTGMWFGNSKPEMTVILEKFVEQINLLTQIGIPCKIKGRLICVKLYILTACVDTSARAPMNGTSQFNAKYGCDWCEHPGIYYEGSMRYPFLDPPAPLRTKESTVMYAQRALETSLRVRGVKYASPLLNLNGFNIITSFTPDYMHCMLAGVAKQFTEYFLDMITDNDIHFLNQLLSQIKAPHQISRLSRDITDRGNWKCREWENWVLYYSLPLLGLVIQSVKYLKHWSLFVESLHLSLQADITYDQLNNIDRLLNAFVAQTAEHYSLKSMTYNVHQLQHIAKSIADWGPLWAHSAFAFESANHQLLSAIKSAKGVILQIIRHINLQRFTQALELLVYPNASESVIYYCTNISSPNAINVFKLSSISYFGKERIIDTYSLSTFNVSRNTKVFRKMVHEGCLFTSCEKMNHRSCNYFAQLRDERFIKINNFLVDVDNKIEITTCQVIKTRAKIHSCCTIKEIVKMEDEIIYVPTNDISRVCIFVKTDSSKYIIPVPNLYFY